MYYEHLKAFHEGMVVTVVVKKTSCNIRSSIAVRIPGSNELGYVKVKRSQCATLKEGEAIKVLQADSGKMYWNAKPTRRIFWLIPVYLLMILYVFIWHLRK